MIFRKKNTIKLYDAHSKWMFDGMLKDCCKCEFVFTVRMFFMWRMYKTLVVYTRNICCMDKAPLCSVFYFLTYGILENKTSMYTRVFVHIALFTPFCFVSCVCHVVKHIRVENDKFLWSDLVSLINNLHVKISPCEWFFKSVIGYKYFNLFFFFCRF